MKKQKKENKFCKIEIPLILVGGRIKKRILKIQELIQEYKKQNKKVGVLASLEAKKFCQEADFILVPGSRNDLKTVTKNLSGIFEEFNKKEVDIILAETFPAIEINEEND